MRCPSCDHRQKLRDGTRCRRCGYRFVFKARQDLCSDYALLMAARTLSEEGRYRYTRTQLALQLGRYGYGERRVLPGAWLALALLLAALATWVYGLAVAAAVFVIAVALSAVMLAVRGALRRAGRWPGQVQARFNFDHLLALIERYRALHPLPGLADGRAYADDAAPAFEDFAPLCVLVVPREDLVDCLIGNGLARKARAVVLSAGGYPRHVARACERFLADPGLPVYLAHDASPEGLRWRDALAGHRLWRGHTDRLHDLGWRPEALRPYRGLLPWVLGRQVSVTRRHRAMLRRGATLPLDGLHPATLLGLLAASLAEGQALRPTPDRASEFIIGYEHHHSDDYG